MKKIIFTGLFILLSPFSFVGAQYDLSFPTYYATLSDISRDIRLPPRYETCCICQFNDTNDDVGDGASESCDSWLAEQVCSFKTKIRSSLSFEPKNIFPYHEYVTGPFCGNMIVKRDGHGALLDRSKRDVFACLRMIGVGGKLQFTDIGCDTFKDISGTRQAARDLSKFINYDDQSIIWTANQSRSFGYNRSSHERFKRDLDEKFLRNRSVDGSILLKPLPDSVYVPVATFLPKVIRYLSMPYDDRLNTPTTAVIKKSGVDILLPKCSTLNKESIAYLGKNNSTCFPKHAQLYCDDRGVTETRVCCGPAHNLRWITTSNDFCPDAMRSIPFVVPQF